MPNAKIEKITVQFFNSNSFDLWFQILVLPTQ